MKMIVGLGNPGKKYERTRHNVGWRVIDALIDDDDVNTIDGLRLNEKFEAYIAKVGVASEDVLLVKPATFMNLSGHAVKMLKDYYKISEEDVWVVCDDLDMPLGWIRIRDKGRDGGHRGLRSIFEENNSDEIVRIRIGIGASLGGEELEKMVMPEAEIYVLQEFEKREEEFVEKSIERVVRQILDGIEAHKIDNETISVV